MPFNIMIVDDSDSTRAYIRKIIGLTGLRVDRYLEAENGKRALELLADNPVDVILTDINMPEMDGLAMLKKMREDHLAQDTPVIVVTTEGAEPHVRTAMELGARGFVKKPFLPEEIKNALLKVMRPKEGVLYEKDKRTTDDVDF
jgi:two-component system, chemotaxis family, chemotaxis protein CheY